MKGTPKVKCEKCGAVDHVVMVETPDLYECFNRECGHVWIEGVKSNESK